MMLSIYTAGKVMPHGDRTLILICCLTLVVVSLPHTGPLSKPFSCSYQMNNKIKLDCIITVCVYVNLRIDIFFKNSLSILSSYTVLLCFFLVDVLNTCSKKDLHFVLSSNNGLLIHIHCTSILISNFMKDDNNDNFLNLLSS